MQNDANKITELRKLIFDQPTDEAWFIEAAKQLNKRVKTLKKSSWIKTKWNKDWGKIIELLENIFLFKRSDGGPDLRFTTDKEDSSGAFIRIALIGKLINEMRNKNLVSYVKINETKDWNKCIVYINGEKIDEVISADAIFNTCEIFQRDKNRKLTLTPDKESFQTQTITGKVVTITKETEPLTFF